ncbi:hypothetical protein F0L17_13405 [Streptomyces sp. TRM43335]|uniref:Uncharacterized protein n=1 Tax=Streptomyces taklimakanensis TaxID=2569853 RepID=A0A6G2BD90_9ACTN|nr:hypothetical protein [Streptomyces taklimakanensis]MTE20096.1 hypothetical protein [Streptomyces taklimakanensis]
MGVRRWWRSRKASAQIERIVDAVNSGHALVADATAYEASGVRQGVAGVLEVYDDHVHFTANSELTAADGGWRTSRSQIAGVRDGDEPGELVIAFRTPGPFQTIVVTPFMHSDKWRTLAAG